MIYRLAVASCIAAIVTGASAYDLETHRLLTTYAVNQSILVLDPVARSLLGLHRTINSESQDQTFPDSRGQPQSVLALIQGGAVWEDDGRRPAHHFFDPRNGRGLHIELSEFPFADPTLVATANAYAQPSPDWALGQSAISTLDNKFRWTAAREYMYSGLTKQNNAIRRQNWGIMFEALGRAVHHIQDMAQPQHVRNDQHWHEDGREEECRDPSFFSICGTYIALHRESAYEKWTNKPDVLRLIREAGYLSNYPAVYPGVDATPTGLVTFSVARNFWTNAGRGMADFTNRNFFSENTIFDINGSMQSSPALTSQFRMKVGDVCANAVPPCIGVTDPDEWVYFWSSSLDDQFRIGQNPMPQPFAVGQSIFGPEFDSQNPQNFLSVRLNRFTFAYDNLYLLPRAVGYSAGLINYFFRGAMDIALPPEGVYAVSDMLASGCTTPCFQKIKLFLKNSTPLDEMEAGKLVAVAKFHRNTCFRMDLSGEFGAPGFDPAICRSPEEFVAVSEDKPVTGLARTFGANPIEFTFPSTSPIPVDATDMYLQVVFRGKLGQESDAVAVTTKDIVEPNYIAVANMTDYVYDDVGNTGYQLVPYATAGSALGVSNFGVAFGTNTTPVVTIAGLGGGQHAQIAFLTDVGDLPATIFFSGTQDTSWILQPEEFKLDDITQKFERSCKVFLARGLYREYQYWFYRRVSDHGILNWKIQNVGSGGRSSNGGGGGKSRMHAEAAHDCGVPTGGVYDYSTMTPFTPTSALPWTINF
jgi:hypothetical protein